LGLTLGLLDLLAGQRGLAAAAEAPAPPATPAPAVQRRTVTATVVNAAGKPVPAVMVFAANSTTDAVAAVATSDAEGKVEMVVPQGRHNFGILSPRFGLMQLAPRGPGRLELVVAALPPNLIENTAGEPAARIDAPAGFVLRGRAVDESGGGLAGVRLEAARESGAIIATVFSSADGTFALGLPGGRFQLRASAPGLNAVRSAHQGGRLVVVMAIAAEAQALTITDGRMFSVRPGDSIDPEYTPPAPVRALLRFAYGICASATPMRARDKLALKKYWYLDVLRRNPPNPAGPYMQAENGNRLVLPSEP
jgi:hypothetical protein